MGLFDGEKREVKIPPTYSFAENRKQQIEDEQLIAETIEYVENTIQSTTDPNTKERLEAIKYQMENTREINIVESGENNASTGHNGVIDLNLNNIGRDPKKIAATWTHELTHQEQIRRGDYDKKWGSSAQSEEAEKEARDVASIIARDLGNYNYDCGIDSGEYGDLPLEWRSDPQGVLDRLKKEAAQAKAKKQAEQNPYQASIDQMQKDADKYGAFKVESGSGYTPADPRWEPVCDSEPSKPNNQSESTQSNSSSQNSSQSGSQTNSQNNNQRRGGILSFLFGDPEPKQSAQQQESNYYQQLENDNSSSQVESSNSSGYSEEYLQSLGLGGDGNNPNIDSWVKAAEEKRKWGISASSSSQSTQSSSDDYTNSGNESYNNTNQNNPGEELDENGWNIHDPNYKSWIKAKNAKWW